MESDWVKRLQELVDKDTRSMREISRAAQVGPNYVEQILKKQNARVNELLKILRQLGPGAAAYVLLGLPMTRADSEYLREVLAVDPHVREAVLRMARDIVERQSRPEEEPSERDSSHPKP